MAFVKNTWLTGEDVESPKFKFDITDGEKINYPAQEQKIVAINLPEKKTNVLSNTLEKMAKYHALYSSVSSKMGLEEPEEEMDEDSARFLQQRRSEMLVWYPRKTPGGGYDDTMVTLDPTPYFNVKDLLARFFIQTHANYGTVHNWRQNVIGITSLCFDTDPALWQTTAHLPMFDYDGKNVKTLIRKDVKILQKDYGLGDAWVYETRRGFHVYFFCDRVSNDDFFAMLKIVQCCKGFKRSATHRGSAVLRVSGKYTNFDIKLLYVLPTIDRAKIRRLGRKAHIIQALLALGEECGTHFASMFPQWAHYQEDQKEWKPAPKPKPGKRIRKVSMTDYELMRHETKVKKMHQQQTPQTPVDATASAATVTFSTDTWITVGNNGTSTSSF